MGTYIPRKAGAIMYEVLVDQLLKQTARKLIVESGNKAYIIE